jgi:glycosyltransferase involved in cell wall biosynthesis
MAADALSITLLKNLAFGVAPEVANRGATPLPYRIDHLVAAGCRLHFTDLPHHEAARRFHDPTVQTARLLPRTLTDPVALAMFESSAHPLGALRHALPPLRRQGFAVLSCWLPELLAGASRRQLERYRRVYDTVDRLFYFSRNQTELLHEVLGVPRDRLVPLGFGIDHEEFTPAEPAPDGPFVAVGRDRGRDWPTLLAALGAAEVPARVICRPRDVRGLAVPSNVEVLGPVSRADYRTHLADARAVLVITHVLGYPTGQSVLLEAMATARACIVTESPAMHDYVVADRTAVVVPPHDVDALTDALRAARDQPDRLATIGRAARHLLERSFTAERMWSTVATELHAIGSGR